MSALEALDEVEVTPPGIEGAPSVLTSDALHFVGALHRKFSQEVAALLQERSDRQKLFDAGVFPLLSGDAGVRASEWSTAEVPRDLADRRVEITGPAGDRKLVINALNSGASTFMADFEDALSPTWAQVIQGQVNLKDAVDGTIRLVEGGKVYALGARPATLIVRPRGLHLHEKHVRKAGQPVLAPFFDYGLFLYHNAEKLLMKGSGPYFYLPKLEGANEARLWERVISASEDYLGLRRGTVKVTVLIETLPAAFEMEEMLYELRRHIVGLNCGRWDYIFSYVKKLRNHPGFVLPERGQLTMDGGFLAPYVDLLIQTCHRRGAYAMGGMSAYIPVKGDEPANRAALEKVRADKEREFALGHDGTWVAHPGLVQVARDAFSKMNGPNQLGASREVEVGRDDLLRVPKGTITRAAMTSSVEVGLRYLDAWLGGRGSVPINNLMEDAATTEICRAQLWQWARHAAQLDDGTRVSREAVKELISNEALALSEGRSGADAARASLAGTLFSKIVLDDDFQDFLTIPAYEELLAMEGNAR